MGFSMYPPLVTGGSFAGPITATNGTFTGTMQAATAQVTGGVTAANVTATGDVGATNGSYTGNLSHHSGMTVPRTWAGRVTVTVSSNFTASTLVTFPAGRFTQPPIVSATMTTAPGGSGRFVPRIINVTTGGATVYVYTGDGSTTSASVVVDIVAFQATDSNASG